MECLDPLGVYALERRACTDLRGAVLTTGNNGRQEE